MIGNKPYFSETERERILVRNKKTFDAHNRKLRDMRRLHEDRQLAKEFGIALEEVQNERINEDD